MLNQIVKNNNSNVIVTIAIGQKYLERWNENSKNSWSDYCEKNGIDLIVITDDLIPKENYYYKKATWQKCLIGEVLIENGYQYENVLYLDSDIFISPLGKNIFDYYDENKIGLVSLRKNLPYDYDMTSRKIAFNRNKYYSERYPLDSALFISTKDLYGYHSLDDMGDEACMGMFVFNIKNHSKKLHQIFFKYGKDVKSITEGGDQTHYNYEIMRYFDVQFLDYEFQAIWTYVMAAFYSHLYKNQDKEYVIKALHESMYNYTFIHFAGSWNESEHWYYANEAAKLISIDFKKYLSKKLSGAPVGMIKK